MALWEQHPVRDLLVDPKPHRAQGAAPTGEQHLSLWEQHLTLWEQHPVRDFPQEGFTAPPLLANLPL